MASVPSAPAAAPAQPPSYEAVAGLGPRAQLPIAELPCFILDGTLIFPNTPPARAMYELSGPPCEAMSRAYTLRKVVHKLSSSASAGGDACIRLSINDIYTFRTFRILLWFSGGRKHVLIHDKTRARFDEALMTPRGSASWKVGPGHLFQAEQRLADRFRSRAGICWLDSHGAVVAVETRLERGEGGTVESLPMLAMRAELQEKLQDLLVACWAARLWKEAVRDLEEPMSWRKCEPSCLYPGHRTGTDDTMWL